MLRLWEWVVCTLCLQKLRKSHCYGGNDFRIGSVGTCLPLLIHLGLSPTVIWNLQVTLPKTIYLLRRSTCARKLHTTRTIISLPFPGKENVLQQHLVLQERAVVNVRDQNLGQHANFMLLSVFGRRKIFLSPFKKHFTKVFFCLLRKHELQKYLAKN